MRNLAIIGASYLQLPLIEKAKEMGFRTHVFAWAANDVGEEAADIFYPISITEFETITEKCKEIGICGICSIATDLGNYTVNYVAEKLGLSGNGMNSTLKCTNKYLMRNTFYENGDPSPRFFLIDEKTDIDELSLIYPVIVKPIDRSGSRGITKVENESQLVDAVKNALRESFAKQALVEEFVEGKEYSVEGISFQGKHHILAITEKFTTGTPHFIETGHKEPAKIDDDVKNRIEMVIKHALNSLEIYNSASHSEIKVDDKGKIHIIEIGSRMGGDCIGSDLVWYSTGIDFLKAVIQISCGDEPDLTPKAKGFPCEVRYILTEYDLKQYMKISKEQPEKILRVIDDRHFELVGMTTDSSNRAGGYILRL